MKKSDYLIEPDASTLRSSKINILLPWIWQIIFLNDKQMIHKLFKGLVPHYKDYQTSYTQVHLIPDECYLAAEKKKSQVFARICFGIKR
ncbi:hypothetical protein CEXT_139021 [Caerostris extrusa]|uniref:Uncharacterized protein n=1 Tax=Caerostris extrusa TaxID=172846 RepID=A0AAV4MJM4_CAEEX|nr:hypothetical protein CEXT_139021 [Caerostris extrusa]